MFDESVGRDAEYIVFVAVSWTHKVDEPVI